MNGYLLDTNVVSELAKPRPEPKVLQWLDQLDERLVHLSVMTIAELRRGVVRLPASRRRALLENWIASELKPRFAERIIPIDQAIAEGWGEIDGLASQRGLSLPLIDGLIAATALQYGLTLATRDRAPLAQAGVSVFDPWAS